MSCDSCSMEGRISALERGQAVLRSDMQDTRRRTDELERNQQAFAVQLDRLSDMAQRMELLIARLEGAVGAIAERPGTIVHVPEQRRSERPGISLGNGKWYLRGSGLPAVILAVSITVLALLWAANRAGLLQ